MYVHVCVHVYNLFLRIEDLPKDPKSVNPQDDSKEKSQTGSSVEARKQAVQSQQDTDT
jgi:hypothetical protein